MPNLQLFYSVIISHRMQGIYDVGVFFRHMFCKHRMALQTMHHGCDVVHRVLYLFYFLALPFLILFYFMPVILLQYCRFASKKLSHHWRRPIIKQSAPFLFSTINPTTVDVHHLRVPCVRLFLRPWRFHEHDEHMHLFQLVSNDQQSSFHLYRPIYRLNH